MVVASFTERPGSGSATSDPPSLTLLHQLTGIYDDAAARAYINSAVPLTEDGLYRQTINVESLGPGLWNIDTPYGPLQKPQLGSMTLTFDTLGGTAHITHAKERIASYDADTGAGPDHVGAPINVTDSGIDGTDIVIPKFTWQEQWIVPIAFATFSYSQVLKQLTGRSNDAAFRGFNAGEVLFLGGTGGISSQDPEWANFSYSFLQEDNTADAVPNFRAGIAKKGTEYVWLESEIVEDGDADDITRSAKYAYVDRVYDAGNMALLGIGTGIPS
jgi:hypothetical protein